MMIEEDLEVSKGRSKAVKVATLERDGYKCRMCGSILFLTNHHVIPLSYGGKDEVENSCIVCRTCHDELHFLYGRKVVNSDTCLAYIDFIRSQKEDYKCV